ncbi:uncharacterized protein C17orf80 homolog isoform X1 [Heteronotia binoei]|uniref:uncharacterized protein C17orf80 homolog isoform X1 n=1 Tax=Heteronotia binoei TaxID=13085 RepID=UPI00292D4275|nr:uncharacterized protein C17orf80 homolog isoform X1 [Heteronotia binoei]
MQVAGSSWNCRIRVLAADRDTEMKSILAAVEICPYCKKPFKRLKSHLPHCKMAGDSSFAVNATEISSPVPVTGNSVTSERLNTKKKGRIKSTDMASGKDNKKSKSMLMGNEEKVKSNSVEMIDTTPVAKLLAADEGIQQQIKLSTKKSQKRENGTPRAPEKDPVRTQAAEKELPKTKLFEKSPRVQKSSSRINLDEEKFVSGIIQEPVIQTGKATSKSPGKLGKKKSAKQRQAKEESAKLSVSSGVDSSMDDLQSSLQEVNDKVKLVIENHRVRVLRKRDDSSVQNIPLIDAAIGNQKAGHQPVESLSGSAGIPLATEKQIITGTENRVLGFELEGNTWIGKTGNAVATVEASDECFLNTCKTVPLQLAAGVKSMMDKNQLSVITHEKSLVYNNPKSNPYSAFTEILQRKGNDERCNHNLTYLENDTALDSGVIVITPGNSSEITLKPPSVHMLEMTAAQRLSSPKRSLQPGSLGLEWFPELYPNYQNLFSGKPKLWDTRISQTQLILPHEDWQAWNGYYNRYINVKKSGVAGISMLLLGYCVLSYAWNYGDIKENRWRKNHS